MRWMYTKEKVKAGRTGLVASTMLFGTYLIVVGLVSGPENLAVQLEKYWYFTAALAVGFGLQVALYSYLKQLIHHRDVTGKIAVVTGATSTAAMVACCTHYLANLLPVLGISGLAAFATQYQVELFLIGLGFNGIGIVTMCFRIHRVKIHD